METIFEKQGMFEKRNSVTDDKFARKYSENNSKFLAEKNFSNFAQNYPVMETHYQV
jgi:hypothetical protein